MKLIPFFRPGLSARLALIVFAVQAVLLAGLAIVIHSVTRRALYDSFDQVLQSNAESIASLVDFEDDEDDEGTELELVEEIMGPRFSRRSEPDLFAVYIDHDTLLEKSEGIRQPPPQVLEHRGKTHFADQEYEGHPYRFVVFSTFRIPDEDSSHQNASLHPRAVMVYYASSTTNLRNQLSVLGLSTAALCLLCVVLSGFLAKLVSFLGLGPLRRLAGDIALIRQDRLEHRIKTSGLQPELLPIASSLNMLLERIENALETERRFSADAAHELRTPVATLKSGLQAALLRTTPSNEARSVYEALLVDVERLEGLCDSLLLLTGNGRESASTLTVEEWIGEIEAALAAVKTGSEAESATFEFDLDQQVPNKSIACNQQTSYRIAANLLGNAVQHGGRGVAIRIFVVFDELHARFIVEDDGPGISGEQAKGLFKRFFRVDKSRSRSEGGYGLGLSICLTLARKFGGNVRHEPNSPRGSRFIWLASFVQGGTPEEQHAAVKAVPHSQEQLKLSMP